MIERNFDVAFVAGLALREKQIQQNYRPIIAVHKWFARRPGTLFRALLLSEFATSPLRDAFYRSNNLAGRLVADHFMGGGTPLLEANRIGCDVVGYDINPMAYWIVREEIEHIDLPKYREAALRLRKELGTRIGHLYKTQCRACGFAEADVKYFLWVKVQPCPRCSTNVDLFPGYLLAENRRHPRNVVVCAICGELNEIRALENAEVCSSCKEPLVLDGPAKKNRCLCSCGAALRYPDPKIGPPRHRLFAIEYHCTRCRNSHQGRFFKKPDEGDVAKTIEAAEMREGMRSDFIPDDEIPRGDETDRLHRWGYRRYAEMFNPRQLIGLHQICELVVQEPCDRIRRALATNLSDLVRYQNMLCRYDTMALKSLDIFSVHGYPVGLIQCESNLLGISDDRTETSVGSGGWSNIAEKYARAKAYCERPFEVRHSAWQKARIYTSGEWIGDAVSGKVGSGHRRVTLFCKDGSLLELAEGTADAVLTDPPYFGNVQYAELMDFCYAWLRRLVTDELAFKHPSTRRDGELTVNASMNRGPEHFTEGLSAVFQKLGRALKPGAPLAFTFHHNSLEAYYSVAAAILDAGLTCSASLPCPAEMGASIHISGTDSSTIDTVFVCRTTGRIRKDLIAAGVESIAKLVQRDVRALESAGARVRVGDIRCIARGHIIRLVVWYLRKQWNRLACTSDKLASVAQKACELPSVAAIGFRVSTATDPPHTSGMEGKGRESFAHN